MIADEDNDGLIQIDEAMNLIRLVQGSEFDNHLDEEVLEIFKSADKNGDGGY